MNDQFHVPDKDPEFVYRWCNTDERSMLQRKAQGYEVVLDDKPEIDPRVTSPDVTPIASSAGVTRRRGTDLVLCRIRKDAFDENIDSRRKALRAQHRGSIEDVVAQTNADTEAALRSRGQHARGLVFRTSPEANFQE